MTDTPPYTLERSVSVREVLTDNLTVDDELDVDEMRVKQALQQVVRLGRRQITERGGGVHVEIRSGDEPEQPEHRLVSGIELVVRQAERRGHTTILHS